MKSYEAGADGIVASREYEEMTVPNLRAVGRAVRALTVGLSRVGTSLQSRRRDQGTASSPAYAIE